MKPYRQRWAIIKNDYLKYYPSELVRACKRRLAQSHISNRTLNHLDVSISSFAQQRVLLWETHTSMW